MTNLDVNDGFRKLYVALSSFFAVLHKIIIIAVLFLKRILKLRFPANTKIFKSICTTKHYKWIGTTTHN